MKFKSVIFDFNGVIVDDYPLQKQAWDEKSQELRGKLVTNSEMIRKIRGVPTKETIKWMAKQRLGNLEIKKLVIAKDKLIKELYQSSSLFKLNKGLVEFLNELRQKMIKRTIATSSSLEMTQFSFRKLELHRWFEFEKIVYNDGKHRGKPHPDPYVLAAEKLGLKPGACVVFEDAKSGIESARRAGIGKIIAVGSENRLQELGKLAGVNQTIHNFTEITLDSALS